MWKDGGCRLVSEVSFGVEEQIQAVPVLLCAKPEWS